MEFLAACYRQPDREKVSLLLQQYQYRRGQAVFGLLCEDRDGRAGGYVMERCLGWFRRLNLKKLLKDPEKYVDPLQEELMRVFAETDRELRNGEKEEQIPERNMKQTVAQIVDFGALFCAEDTYFMLRRGTPAVYFMNTFLGKAGMRRLEGQERGQGMYGGQGRLEADIELLLATEGFYGVLPETVMKEGLFVREIEEEKQMEKRLRELGRESERLGGTDIGSIMIRTGKQV